MNEGIYCGNVSMYAQLPFHNQERLRIKEAAAKEALKQKQLEEERRAKAAIEKHNNALKHNTSLNTSTSSKSKLNTTVTLNTSNSNPDS